MISEGSLDTEDLSNDSAFTEINYIFIQTENSYFKM